MSTQAYAKAIAKKYKCARCGHETTQTTNHFGQTWSVGRFNCCPACPSWAKYTDFGGQTIWECTEQDTESN